MTTIDKENGKNPFGDSNQDNRKFNTDFSQQDTSCQWDWQCENGHCVILLLCGELNIVMKSNSFDNGTVTILQEQFKFNSNNNHNIDSNNDNSIRKKRGN